MTPAYALGQAIAFGCSCVYTHKRSELKQPGAIVSKMRGEAREALGRLTSDDLAQIRIEPWELQGDEWGRQQTILKLLQDFDHQIAKFDPGFSHT